ncbi:MAG TPA: glycosyltransferase [Abditibacterium sp.]|jgi:GT2 family glycosyltransferase
MKITLIIVTLGRPLAVERCLKQAHEQSEPIHQIIVVDGDDKEEARPVVARYPGVLYVRNPNGFGRMTGSRNVGLLQSTGDIIAYIDDDAYCHREWAREIAAPYADPKIGAVGGRALNGVAGEESRGIDQVGRFSAKGEVLGFFGADTGKIVEVDHLIGCNMSFRRDILGELGGFHEFYPGFCSTYEEADLCFRIKKLGYRIVFNPRCVVDHEGAPRKVGKRFDAPYIFRVTRNHGTLLMRCFGVLNPVPWVFLAVSSGRQILQLCRKIAGATWRFATGIAGLWVGLAGGIVQRARQGSDLRRRDAMGREISAHLGSITAKDEKTSARTGAPQTAISEN